MPKTKTPVKYAADGKTPLALVRKRLEKVADQITRHYKKYSQSQWGNEFSGGGGCTINTCESVGCIAGWLDLNKNGTKVHLSRASAVGPVAREAQTYLGIPKTKEYPWLFIADFGERLGEIPYAGTKAHAALAVRAIKLYLKEIGA